MHAPVGPLIRHWRRVRRMSQADLATAAEVSARHLSCLETGKAQPSREMVLYLCSALDVPLRERNVMLHAAGFAAAYRQTGLTDPSMADVRKALEFMLRKHNPYPAAVVDAQWNVLLANDAHHALMGLVGGADGVRPSNQMRAVFDPAQLRPLIVNFDELAPHLLGRLDRDGLIDPRTARLAAEMRALSPLPKPLRKPLLGPAPLLVPLVLDLFGTRLELFSTLTTLGTAMDVTLQEIRLETTFPANGATENALRTLTTA